MPTIKDIAKQLGVSVSTVSRALNNHPDIREETKQEVLEAMKRFNYTPNAVARSLIQRKSNTVGLMIPDITDPFFSAMAHDVEEVLSENGYQVVYVNTSRRPDKEKRFLTSVMERKMDGIIVTPDFLDEEAIELLQRLDIPVVFLRRRPPAGLGMPFVDVNHYEGTCNAMDYLFSLGHRRIGFIGMPRYSFTGQERYRGYVDSLNRQGIEPDSKAISWNGRTIECGYKAMGRLLQDAPDMTAVFAANDLLGIGALEYSARHHIAVPGRISVIGFDNLEMTNLHWIKLSTVAQPRKEMGRQAAELLLQMMQSNQRTADSIILDTELIIRSTCSPVNGPDDNKE
ncbi:LacI family transcriptional regulator [Paenibacillus doosanensis]|uniref:HTH-type transcriptional repressor CytR n=1 Tax=Paenibacillus konkukensis TaxID=2020716 RepID=A0ABY4RNK3_9BACL|nr:MULTISPECIES: LacI family DNA-binding transcriptional regulator [Paenibacillus]MCS7463490.1 LacI family transcriptional regulator [Paenibacillus doosanensis]UQZ83426.1 HTH-type transcriptional repressor CytR [Paenibacillus konkukensis]